MSSCIMSCEVISTFAKGEVDKSLEASEEEQCLAYLSTSLLSICTVGGSLYTCSMSTDLYSLLCVGQS